MGIVSKDSHENIAIGYKAITRGAIAPRVSYATTGLPVKKNEEERI